MTEAESACLNVPPRSREAVALNRAQKGLRRVVAQYWHGAPASTVAAVRHAQVALRDIATIMGKDKP